MSRFIDYANEISNGPPGREYPLPIESADVAIFPEWFQQFTSLEPEQVFDVLSRPWRPSIPIIEPIVQFLATLTSPALYHLEEGDEFDPVTDALVLKNQSHVFFFTSPLPLSEHISGFPPDLLQVLSAFNGMRIGFNMQEERFMRHDSGFIEAQSLIPLSRDHDPCFWCNHEDYLGGLQFFTTPCGNILVAFRNGEIAKWDHETSKMRTCFGNIAEFVEGFVAFYSGFDRSDTSPFSY